MSFGVKVIESLAIADVSSTVHETAFVNRPCSGYEFGRWQPPTLGRTRSAWRFLLKKNARRRVEYGSAQTWNDPRVFKQAQGHPSSEHGKALLLNRRTASGQRETKTMDGRVIAVRGAVLDVTFVRGAL